MSVTDEKRWMRDQIDIFIEENQELLDIIEDLDDEPTPELVELMKPERAKKNNAVDGKVSRRFIHYRFLDELGLALAAGELKYGAYNFTKGHDLSQLLDAAQRHLEKIQWGEWEDADCTERLGRSVSHLGCAAASLNMIMAQLELGTLNNDSPQLSGDKENL